MMTLLTTLYRDFINAAMILTVIPHANPNDQKSINIAQSYWAFPLIGIGIVALPAIGAIGLIQIGTPPLATAGLAIAATIIITGGLHYDGIADVADSMHGKTKTQRLAIMHDSKTGSFALLALVISILIQAAALAHISSIGTDALVSTMLVAAAISRAMMALQQWYQPPPDASQLAKSVGRPTLHIVFITLMLGFACGLFFAPLMITITAMFVSIILTLALGRFLKYWIGGVNGDGLGTTQVINEIAVLLVFSIAL